VEIARHPDADKLYVEKIDIGETSGPRTVLSGLVSYIPMEELLNKKVLVFANLKPAVMRGIGSQGMLLCAEGKAADGSVKMEIVAPPADAQIGARVTVASTPGEADVQLDPKKKDAAAFAAILAELNTSSDGIAQYRGTPLMTEAGPCSALPNAKLS
jgi:tRNA-binding EMAP/Myf-like protein